MVMVTFCLNSKAVIDLAEIQCLAASILEGKSTLISGERNMDFSNYPDELT